MSLRSMTMRLVLATLLTFSFAATSSAAIILSDTFPTDGAPPPGYTLVSGTGGQAVVGGQLVMTASGTGNGTGDYYKAYPGGTVNSGIIYAGYDLTITAAPTDATDNYFAHFATNATGGGNFFARVALNLVSGNTVLGISESAAAPTTFSSALTIGTTYRVVQAYDFAAGEARLWINPVLETDTFLSDASGTNGTATASFNFRISGTSDGNKTIDNFVVATTFAEALGTVAIPEPSTIAFSAMAGLGLLGFRLRRKQG